jgi:hypothetical protein
MARERPSAANQGVCDEAGIAVLILCLCHSIGFAVLVTLFPQFRTAMPQAEILARLLGLTAVFVSLVILGTGICVHQDRGTLVRFSLGTILLLLSLCGLVDCHCTEAPATYMAAPHAALLNASLPSVPCLILISAHVRNRRVLWLFLQKSRRSGKRPVRRFIL